jgi:predicted metal-dependent phosphoesterase TrpH
MREFRQYRAQRIGELLQQAGIPGAYEAAKELAKGQLISRTHFAQFLIANGHAKSMQQVFKRFLVKGKPGHVPGEWASLKQAMDWIHAANGMAVIAHPARYKISATALRRLLEEFVALDGTGLEVVSGSHTEAECIKMADYAKKYSLYGSAGSDYHGANHPWRKLGEMPDLPESLTPIWQHKDWPQAAALLAR